MSSPPRRDLLVKVFVFACLSLTGVDRAGAQEAADPVDVSFHLDDASLPDPVRSPGGTSPDLTTEDLCETPAADFASLPPAALCDDIFAEHRISPDHRFQYRCGFLVPPAIGGSDARRNVWLQPANEAAFKQAIDTEARKDVCRNGIALKEAQTLMARDWVGLYRKFFRPNDKLLPIAKTERAAASFDGPPPLPVPPAASPRAYLDNPSPPGGSTAEGGPSAGDAGAGGGFPDDRRRRRRLRDGVRDPSDRPPSAVPRADASRPGVQRPGSSRTNASELGLGDAEEGRLRRSPNGPDGGVSNGDNRGTTSFGRPNAGTTPHDRADPTLHGPDRGGWPARTDGPRSSLGVGAPASVGRMAAQGHFRPRGSSGMRLGPTGVGRRRR